MCFLTNMINDKYDQYDFTNWAKGIQRGGYARSKTWSSQVIGLIKKYELFKYDERPEGYIEPPVMVVKSSKATNGAPAKTTKTKGKYYTVKKGDNLNSLAGKTGTTSSALMRKNNLKSSALQPGQRLKL
jgi:LysM repeat protein